jgi:hypothetical protein
VLNTPLCHDEEAIWLWYPSGKCRYALGGPTQGHHPVPTRDERYRIGSARDFACASVEWNLRAAAVESPASESHTWVSLGPRKRRSLSGYCDAGEETTPPRVTHARC